MIKKLISLLFIAILIGCGGPNNVPAVEPPASSASQPTNPTPPTPPASSASQPTPEPQKQWKQLLKIDWTSSDTFGGYVATPPLVCDSGQSDPNYGFWVRNINGTFGFINEQGAKAGIKSSSEGKLVIDSYQDQIIGGFAILSKQRFPIDKPLKITTRITLEPDDGSWISFPLINGEADYRQITIRWNGVMFVAELGAPCFYKFLKIVPYGPTTLDLQYWPNIGWKYIINNEEVYVEALTNNNANLVDNPHVGIYVVNVKVEAKELDNGRVRATVDPIEVSQLSD